MAGREEAEALAGTGKGSVAVPMSTAGVEGGNGCGGEAGSWGKGSTGSAPGPTKVSASKPKEVTNGLKC